MLTLVVAKVVFKGMLGVLLGLLGSVRVVEVSLVATGNLRSASDVSEICVVT